MILVWNLRSVSHTACTVLSDNMLVLICTTPLTAFFCNVRRSFATFEETRPGEEDPKLGIESLSVKEALRLAVLKVRALKAVGIVS